MATYEGGCHCGRVRFEIDAPVIVTATQCNCSICKMSGFLHLFVSHKNFRLMSGEDDLTTYRFNTGVAQHSFCKHCGIKSFYVPRSHPDGLSINVNCLDAIDMSAIDIVPFDGQKWEQNISELSAIND